ncbi:hypothetical protein ACWD4P_28970 [Kitasatospora sp. NPDC002543]
MAFSDGAPVAGCTTPAAPDYSPATWPEPVALRPRHPLDPLGTVLIPPAERRLFTRAATGGPAPAAAFPTAALPVVTLPTAALPTAAPAAVPVMTAPGPLLAPPARYPGPEDRPRTRRLTLPGGTEARRQRLLERVRVPLRARHRIAVLGDPTEEGTVALGALLGGLLAEHRAHPVLVLSTTGTPGNEFRTGSRLVLRSVKPDPAALRQALDEADGHYPVVLADTAGAPPEVQLTAAGHTDHLLLHARTCATGARTTDALIDHLTALGHGHLVHGAVAAFTPAAPTDRPVADRDLLPHFRTRCRGALALPHTAPGRRPRTRLDHLELAALVGDAMAERQRAGAGTLEVGAPR